MSDLPPTAGARAISEEPVSRWAWFSGKRATATVIVGASALLLFIWLVFVPKAPKEDTTKPLARAQPAQYEGPKPIPIVAKIDKPNVITPPIVQPIAPSVPFVPQVVEQIKPPTRPAVYSFAPTTIPEYLKPKPEQPNGGKPKEEATTIAYKSASIPGSKTMTIPDRNLLLMPGPLICTMDTAINTDVAGPFRCTLKSDALSPTNVTLMEAGTQIIGGYTSTVTQGQNRVVAVTAFATTPNGVVVPLGGPIADEIGAAGVEGSVNNHWGARIGAAVLLSLVDNAFSLAQAELSKAGSTNLNISGGGGSNMASQVLNKTINIPPTITLSQGTTVALWNTGIIDFGPSYLLESVH